MLVPHLDALLARATERGIVTKVQTNGKLLTPKRFAAMKPYVGEVGLSLDALDDKMNAFFGRGKKHCAMTMDRIKMAKDAGVPVSVTSVLMWQNADELSMVALALAQQKVDLWQVSPFSPARGLAAKNRDLFTAPNYELKISTTGDVKGMPVKILPDSDFGTSAFVITPNGKVYEPLPAEPVQPVAPAPSTPAAPREKGLMELIIDADGMIKVVKEITEIAEMSNYS